MNLKWIAKELGIGSWKHLSSPLNKEPYTSTAGAQHILITMKSNRNVSKWRSWRSDPLTFMGICMLLAAAIAAILYFGYPSGGVKRAAQINAYYHLQVAHQRFLESGELASSANKVFTFTNMFRMNSQEYQCIIAMEWPHGCPAGTLVAATSNGTTLWLEPGKNPKVISFPKTRNIKGVTH